MIASREYVKDLISKILNNIDTGEIRAFMRNTAPRGFLICDGSIYNIEDYPKLSNLFLEEFGSYNYFGGDGINTFCVPDLRGEFLRGTGTNSHTDGGIGSNVGKHQDPSKIPAIFDQNGTSVAYCANTSTNYYSYDTLSASKTAKNYNSFNSNSYASGNYNNYATVVPTNTAVLYCIKY